MEKNRAIQIADQIKALDLKQMDKVELVDISLLINIYLIELSKKIDDELIARDVKFYISTFGGKLYQISQNQPKVLDKKINNNQKILKYCLDNGIKEVWDNLTIKQSWLDENRWYDNSFAKEWKQETQKVIKKYKIKEVKEKLDYGK